MYKSKSYVIKAILFTLDIYNMCNDTLLLC